MTDVRTSSSPLFSRRCLECGNESETLMGNLSGKTGFTTVIYGPCKQCKSNRVVLKSQAVTP